jgi:hypothetical protein
MCAKMGSGMPQPARIVADRARQCDQVGIAGTDKLRYGSFIKDLATVFGVAF